MSEDSCPIPRPAAEAEEAAIRRMLASRRIAVVGLSDDPNRPSHDVAAYLQAQGYAIVPVNPNIQEALGRRAVASLAELDASPDVVLVFRRSEHAAQATAEAVAAGAKGVWLQTGVRSDEARRLAEKAGVDFVQDRCMKVEHVRKRGNEETMKGE